MSWPQLLFLVFAIAAILGICTGRICNWLSLIQRQLANSTDYLTEGYKNGLGELSDRLTAVTEQWSDYSDREMPPQYLQLRFAEVSKLRDVLWMLDRVQERAIKKAKGESK